MFWQNFFRFRNLNDEPKPLLEHLEDLRGVLIKMAVVLVVGMVVSFAFRGELAAIIQHPLVGVDPDRAANLQSLGVPDSMMISLQISFYAGIILAFPFLLFFLAEFIVPALNEVERKMLFPAAAAGFLLFLGGVLFGYFFVLPQALEFFFEDAKKMNWQPTWTVRDYYSFATQFIIAFGLAFELPVVVLALVRLGLVSVTQLRQTRSFAVVLIFLFAAIITPTQDIFTLLLMGVPMLVLYEGCILVAGFMEKRWTAGE